jgi:small subunit ribosomal protein S8
MVVKDHLSAMMNDLLNCKKASKRETIVIPATNIILEVLKIMKKEGYVKNFKVEEDKFRKVTIQIGKINKCGSIKPRFYVKKNEIDKYVKRYLPARNFGVILISTDKGIITHNEAIEKNLGGTLIAYVF